MQFLFDEEMQAVCLSACQLRGYFSFVGTFFSSLFHIQSNQVSQGISFHRLRLLC